MAQQPVAVSRRRLQDMVELARSSSLYLSVYLPADGTPSDVKGIHVYLANLLEDVGRRVAGTPLEKPLQGERELMESLARDLRPGGPGLALISSREAGQRHAVWLPEPPTEHVRFGPGAYVLPLIDTLDEWEPIGLAFVEKDQARVMVITTKLPEVVHHLEAEVPGRHRAEGGFATGYRPGIATIAAGGGHYGRFESHILEGHVRPHLKRVVEDLERLHREYGFHRIYVGGPPDAVTQCVDMLPHPLSEMLMGRPGLDSHATDAAVAAQIRDMDRANERQHEVSLVEELITRAEKGELAVTGMDTVWAINLHDLHSLVIDLAIDLPGRRCTSCEQLLPPEEAVCPRCHQQTQTVDLREELSRTAFISGLDIEVVHGQAASLLWHVGGVGGFLEPKVH